MMPHFGDVKLWDSAGACPRWTSTAKRVRERGDAIVTRAEVTERNEGLAHGEWHLPALSVQMNALKV